jgi:PQQ-dependent dehydrogenase (methanol/ethanol family)
MEAAAKTWTGEWWKMGGGGSIWDGMAYDPDENLLYVGTGNGLPWPQDIRQGKGQPHLDNLYIASIVAINAETGQLKWHYQCTPGDQWDYDAIQHLVLAELRINNRTRKVIMQANKNGYFYVIDRVTGEFISAGEMSQISWSRGMDSKGRPMINPEAYYSSERGVTVYPVQMHNASQMSFNPMTGLIYVPINPSSTFNFTAADEFTANPGNQNLGLARGARGAPAPPLASPAPYGPVRRGADGNPIRGGILTAWNPVTQKEVWFALGGGQTDGGVLTTASNLVVQTTPQGHLMVYTADKGEKLLDLTLPLTSGVGPPMTYQLDNKQYIAVMAGTGAAAFGGGRGGNRGGNRGGAPQEPTAAAANVPPPPAAPPAASAAPGANNPKLFVYTIDAAAAR